MRVDVVRVFTRDGAGGNHLGIVEGHLDADAMQSIARSVGHSETVFIDETDGVAAARIFTPGHELPFAGHPLVGAGWWLREQGRPVRSFTTGVGAIAVSYDGARAVIEAPLDQPVTAGTPPPGIVGAVDVAVVAMPLPYTVIEVSSAAALEALEPDEWEFIYCFARVDERTVRSRFFAADAGIVEDPATGSAAVALAARLQAAGTASGKLTIFQGEEIGHPSQIDLGWSAGTATVGGTSASEPALEID